MTTSNPYPVNIPEVHEVVGAIDTLQDIGLIGDEHADVIFQEYLDMRDLSLQQYYRITGLDKEFQFYNRDDY